MLNWATPIMLLVLALPSVARADGLSPAEKQKIESLIRFVGQSKDTTFVRNGSEYNAGHAATFLRRKWEANTSGIMTARDFVDKVASFSGTSGKPYLIRFKDGKELKAQEYLLTELRKIESKPGVTPSVGTD